MKMKRAVMMAVLVIAVAAMALPLMKTKAAVGTATPVARPVAPVPTSVAVPETATPAQETRADQGSAGKIDPEFLKGLGVRRGNGQKEKARANSTVDTQSGTP